MEFSYFDAYYVTSFTGITKAEINVLTGSLLIEYQPKKLRSKPKLAALEDYLKNKPQKTLPF